MKKVAKPYISAILLAGGQGSRFGCSEAKQWYILCGKSILRRSIEIYAGIDEIDELVLVLREEDMARAKNECIDIKKPITFVAGGSCRAESSKNGAMATNPRSEMLLIADTARCLTHPEDIRRVISAALECGAAAAVGRITDTVKECADKQITNTLNRELLCVSQTPQAMRLADYKNALDACASLSEITDDCMLLEQIGIYPRAVICEHANPKLTKPDDIAYFKALLVQRGDASVSRIRIGHGYDVHRLVEGRALILGGVEIAHSKGLLGHSDADVLIHAIMDAVLGALSLGDIGKHFPDSSEEFRGISSITLARRVAQMMRDYGASIGNLDATLVLEEPKVSPYINNMKENIAHAFDCPIESVNLKATTEEGLGFSGRKEGISATALVSLIFD